MNENHSLKVPLISLSSLSVIIISGFGFIMINLLDSETLHNEFITTLHNKKNPLWNMVFPLGYCMGLYRDDPIKVSLQLNNLNEMEIL